MFAQLSISAQEVSITRIFFLCLAVYLLYYFLTTSLKFKNYFFNRFHKHYANISFVSFQRIFGFIFLGVVPLMIEYFLFSTPVDYLKINTTSVLIMLKLAMPLFFIAFLFVFFGMPKDISRSFYPQIKINLWSIRSLTANIISWVIYLTAYEILFRGLLFNACLPVLGKWPSIALNTAIYTFVHIPKGLKECLGSIIFGVILCSITIMTGNIWLAVILHIWLALLNDYMSIRANPEMKIKIL